MIIKKPEVVYNSISEQMKRGVNSLTLVEWNFIINSLRVQANVNADQIKYIHSVLFGLDDVSIDGVALIPELYDKIYNGVIDRAAADGNGNNIINTYATKTELADLLELIVNETVINRAKHDQHGNVIDETYARVADVEDGTTVVDKALRDSLGNVIKDSYASQFKLEVGGAANTRTINWRMASPTQDMNALPNVLSYGGITLPTATTGGAGLMTNTDKTRLDNLHDNAELITRKGQANGYAPLDSNTKLPLVYLYDSVLGQLEYVGTFDGANVPTQTQNLSPNRPVRKGDYFIASGNGLIDGIDFKVGDWLIFDSATAWQKIDNTDAVASVNGKMGVVVLDGTDIEVGDGDTTKLNARFIGIDTILNDTYRKNDVYTKIETDNLLNQLKAIYGWEDSILYDFEGEAKFIPSAEIAEYSFLLITVQEGAVANFDSRLVSVNDMLSLTNSQEIILYGSSSTEIGRMEAVFNYGSQVVTGLSFDGSNPAARYIITGIKMEQQKAENVAYNDGNVADVLDTELRQIGEETLTYTSGKLTKVESDVLKTELFYDGNGKVNKVEETYKVDNLKYETTFTFNVDGLINKITKELI